MPGARRRHPQVRVRPARRRRRRKQALRTDPYRSVLSPAHTARFAPFFTSFLAKKGKRLLNIERFFLAYFFFGKQKRSKCRKEDAERTNTALSRFSCFTSFLAKKGKRLLSIERFFLAYFFFGKQKRSKCRKEDAERTNTAPSRFSCFTSFLGKRSKKKTSDRVRNNPKSKKNSRHRATLP